MQASSLIDCLETAPCIFPNLLSWSCSLSHPRGEVSSRTSASALEAEASLPAEIGVDKSRAEVAREGKSRFDGELRPVEILVDACHEGSRVVEARGFGQVGLLK